MRWLRNATVYALLTLIAASTIIPLVWMVGTSLHPSMAQTPTLSGILRPDKSRFVEWTGDAKGLSPELTVAPDHSQRIEATFVTIESESTKDQPPEPTREQTQVYRDAETGAEITILTHGAGTVRATPIADEAGRRLRLRAVPDSKYYFENY
ncbi:MAG: hypothetical protein HZB38_18735 [Planctomycetes bacterium]|nr:hypothetical protein [Planctomycetota bacterium]